MWAICVRSGAINCDQSRLKILIAQLIAIKFFNRSALERWHNRPNSLKASRVTAKRQCRQHQLRVFKTVFILHNSGSVLAQHHSVLASALALSRTGNGFSIVVSPLLDYNG